MYSYNPDLANAAYLQGQNTSGALKRLIGVNASNLVSIDADGLGTIFGGSVKATHFISGNGTASDAQKPLYISQSVNQYLWAIIENTNAGGSAFAGLQIGGDGGTLYLRTNSIAYSAAGLQLADGSSIYTDGGPLVIGTIPNAEIHFGQTNVIRLSLSATALYPVDNALTLGNATHRFSDLFTVNDHVYGYTTFAETAAPGVAGVNEARLYARDNGSAKTQLVVIFQSGAVQVLATEP